MFENFPYSNFHDLNTDWIIKRVKNVETSEANAKASEEAADEVSAEEEDDESLLLLPHEAKAPVIIIHEAMIAANLFILFSLKAFHPQIRTAL